MFHQNRLNKETYLPNIMPKTFRPIKPLALLDFGNNYRHINIAIWIGIPLAVRTKHIHLGSFIKTRSNHLLELSYEFECFVLSESFSLIHSCNVFVVSIMFRQVSFESRRDNSCLYLG